MAPRTTGAKKNTPIRHNHNVAAEGSTPLPSIDYEAVQQDEVEALQAIFMDDFEHVEVESAWSKTSERRFKLRIAAFDDPESYFILSVRLTATYPRSLPLLEASGLEKFHERTRDRISAIIRDRPKQLLGDVMIHAIATDIQEALEDAVQARQQGTLPSLNDERANAEEVATAIAKQAEDAEALRLKEAEEEEQRVLSQMVKEELSRRDRRKNARSTENADELPSAVSERMIRFEEAAPIVVGREEASFKDVSIISNIEGGLVGKPQLNISTTAPLLAIRQYIVDGKREALTELEAVLNQVRALRHQSISSLYQYRFDKNGDVMTLTTCVDLESRGSLHDLLSLAGSIHVDKARRFSIELLEALEECHRRGIAHGSINCETIVLSGAEMSTLRLTGIGYARIIDHATPIPGKWHSADVNEHPSANTLKKMDVYSLGLVILQMCLGLNIMNRYASLEALQRKIPLSDSFEELIGKMCNADPKKRPSPFDLLAAEFLRSEDQVLDEDGTAADSWLQTMSKSPVRRRSRLNSSIAMETPSRYAQDFSEIGRLGKGGFGEVVKARNKLDGGIYAIKKIVRAPQLDQILSEVMLLNRLNHPYVVRYYSTWVEENGQPTTDEAASMTEETLSSPQIDFGYPSTGGLDFVSSSGYPLVEFGDDSDSEESSDEGDQQGQQNRELEKDDSSDVKRLELRKMRSASRKVQKTLYIQMEFCERRTMRDFIRRGISEDECWRYIRQITEGLAHVHSHGIIHRDLKPDNIFVDVAGNPKIGDFGLATTSQHHDRNQALGSNLSVDMTMSVGTAMYIAPEIGAGSGPYNEKVDMYSLGIIFFEMCEPFATAMERIKALQEVRRKEHDLPASFHPNGEKHSQGKVITCLIAHKPNERPSSTELLRTGLLPVKIEDETIRQALSSLADPRSPNHQKMMSALFAHDHAAEAQVKALAWDAKDHTTFDEPARLRAKAIARDAITSVFKLHGAEEVQRDHILPRSTQYSASNVVQLLDASGNLLQLPYDLTLPHARQLARSKQAIRCTYTFGQVYRDNFSGGPPNTSEEIDFDIVTEAAGADLALDDAEVLKVLDGVVTDAALLIDSATTSFHINHTAIVDAILTHCRVPLAQFAAVKECISKLGFRHFTWSKIKGELRSHALGLSITTVDDLEQFDFRDTPDKAIGRILEIFQLAGSSPSAVFEAAVQHIQTVVQHANNLKITRKIWLAPLSCFNAKFFENGILIQCIHQRKITRDVIAAGGRYSNLVKACARSGVTRRPQDVVGVSIGLDRVITNMLKQTNADGKGAFVKNINKSATMTKRCDVQLVIGRGDATRDVGLRTLAALWQGNISTELSFEEAVGGDHEYSFVVILRHEASTSVKVRSLEDDTIETDVPLVSLVAHLQQEIREKQASRRRQPLLARHPSQNTVERRNNVQVLTSQHRSKKSNKYNIVEAAQQRWCEKLDQLKDAPILAIETRDDVIELLRDTRLNDAESWKRALHGVQPNERQYLQQVQELLLSWRRKWVEEDQAREACIFNFRTGHSIYYDLGL